MSIENIFSHIKGNWKSGLTVALIAMPLSIALSIASGAGPLPGIITGIWATLIASLFGGSNYNIIGAAGALTTLLFAATLAAPYNLGPLILPFIALAVGFIILLIWLMRADRFLYYIPSSVMYGFATGVAVLIAVSQLFDATGLSFLQRTGTFVGDIQLYREHQSDVDIPTIFTFIIFLVILLLWKRFIKSLPAVIPVALLGIIFGFTETKFINSFDLISLGDKFGSLQGGLYIPVSWEILPQLLASHEAVLFIFKTAAVVALIAVLETLITAKIADKVTRTQSSSRKELLGLALANIGSGVFGGLPATGVFVRTGANIKAGATHRVSAMIAAIVTALITLVVLPYFIYLPFAVVAAILVNTALGLVETEKLKEFWQQEKMSFGIVMLVAAITVFEDAGIAVFVGVVLSLLLFIDRVSYGRFDVFLNFEDGTKEEWRGIKVLHIPQGKPIHTVTYSLAGFLGYIDSARHAANFRHLARAKNVRNVIIRLRDLFTLDFEGSEMLSEAIETLESHGKCVYISSANLAITERLKQVPAFTRLTREEKFCTKTSEALERLRVTTSQSLRTNS